MSATARSIGSATPEHIIAIVMNPAAIASRTAKGPDSGTTRIAASPRASGATSVTCHAFSRFSKPVPSTAKTVTKHSATHASIRDRTITCHSSTTAARCATITSAMYGTYEWRPTTE